MTATLTPLPAGTDVAETIGGKAHSRSLIMDPTGADAVGVVGTTPAANTLLGRLKGANDALGAPADAAWASGNGSLVALMKAIAGALGAIDATDASAANQNTLNTAVGTTADAAWTGTGNAGLIALFKAVALQMLDTTAAQVTLGTLSAAETAASIGKTTDATTVSSIIGLLKLLGTYLDGLEGSMVQIGGYLDTVEAGIGVPSDGTSVQSLVGLTKLQNTYLDGLESAVGTPADATSVQSFIGLTKLQNTYLDGVEQLLQQQYDVTTAGYSLTGGTYAAPTGVTIAANAPGPTTVTLPRSGYYALDASFTGTSPSLKVQILGVDGTWLDVVTRTVSGAASDPIQFPAGAQIRLFNASAGSLTAVKGRVS